MKTERVLKKNAIKAYKAFNSDLTCRDFQYEVGKTYRHNAVLKCASQASMLAKGWLTASVIMSQTEQKLEFARFWLGAISREIPKTPSYVHPESTL